VKYAEADSGTSQAPRLCMAYMHVGFVTTTESSLKDLMGITERLPCSMVSIPPAQQTTRPVIEWGVFIGSGPKFKKTPGPQ